jgi:hypothetical protein
MSREILLLCHAKNQKYDSLIANFSQDAKKHKTLDIYGHPDFKGDITRPIASLKNRFQLVTSVGCPFSIYNSKQTFRNIYNMLAPGGLFMTKFGGVDQPVLKLTQKQREKYDVPVSYDFTDISKIISSPQITRHFNVVYVCQHSLNSKTHDMYDGYIYTSPENKTAYANMKIPKCLINVCDVLGVDIVKWIKHNRMGLVVMQKI